METEGLQVGHFIRRGVTLLRWDLTNNNLQCPDHNSLHEYDPEPYRDAMVACYGHTVVKQLEREADSSRDLSYVEMLAIRDHLRAELKGLKG